MQERKKKCKRGWAEKGPYCTAGANMLSVATLRSYFQNKTKCYHKPWISQSWDNNRGNHPSKTVLCPKFRVPLFIIGNLWKPPKSTSKKNP